MMDLNKIFKVFIINKLTAILIGLTFINVLICQNLNAQGKSKEDGIPGVNSYYEELYLQTDRDIYITGEAVWFKVYKLNGLTHTPGDISKVVYLEFLDKNNFPLKQLKVKTGTSSGSSMFIIPATISSGKYVIRAYTNWMQNSPVEQFYYKTISVINPFESIDHLKLSPEPFDPKRDSTLQLLNSPLSSDNLARKDEVNNNQSLKFIVSPGRGEYSAREKVKIEIVATDMSGKPIESDLSISIAIPEVVSSGERNGIFGPVKIGDMTGSDSIPRYIPEMEGHLISGHIRMKITDEPLRNTDVSLAYVGKTARCQFGKTDEEGRFYFVVKESGLSEIVIQPLTAEITGYYVELNQPFSNRFSSFEPSPLYLDSSKIEGINRAIIGMQINNIYEPFRQIREETSKTSIPDFYGKPENTILMADYIELTSLREVVKEIIPNVYTLKQNGKYDFKLINKFRGQPFENKPLILIDGVPVYDFEKVLSINSKEIERVDIINTRYFYSENVFDGIVSFITKKGNLSALEFDNTTFRQVYEACQDRRDFYSPDYSTPLLKESRIPDFRNTLYWNPELVTDKEGKVTVEFYTSDESGEYTIIVEGISPDGRKGYSSTSLIVK